MDADADVVAVAEVEDTGGGVLGAENIQEGHTLYYVIIRFHTYFCYHNLLKAEDTGQWGQSV